MSAKVKPWDIYFQPGQIIFHVSHEFKSDPTALTEWAKDIAAKAGKKVTISEPEVFTVDSVKLSDSPIYSRQTSKGDVQPAVADRQSKLPFLKRIFQTAPQAKAPPTFSLISARVDKDNWPPFKAYKDDDEPDAQMAQKNAFKELFALITLLDDQRSSAPVKLKAVSPNWLMSGVPSGPSGTGGPGGKPSSANEADARLRTFSSQQDFLTRIPSNTSLAPEAAEGVTVAILDTCYPEEKWKEIKTAWPKHPLITSLLGTPSGVSGVLNVHPDSPVDRYLPEVKIDGHDYDMTDHGLFIAGIINSLAPEAELHLYQVLNRYGLGDMLTIAHALDKIREDFSDRLDKLFINMSLTLNLPLKEEHIEKDDEIGQMILDKSHSGEWFWNLIHWICRIMQWILRWFFPRLVLGCRWSWADRQALAFEWISDLMYVLGPGVIAAAGNNGSSDYRPAALYPAAFDSVLGVGALSRGTDPTRLEPASYSDLADTPTTQGVAVFGGEEGDRNGVPGVYVGNFPDGTPNTSGWAWWAGTSFATPIITGLAAALVISRRATNAREAINILMNNYTGFTPAFERIIPVEP